MKHQLFGHWRWAYFGDDASPRVLFIAQQRPDELSDTLWYLGAENSGAIAATNGMIVFGFGRGPNGASQFRGAEQEFVFGFAPGAARTAKDHAPLATTIEALTHPH
jgi:hypothetical protein